MLKVPKHSVTKKQMKNFSLTHGNRALFDSEVTKLQAANLNKPLYVTVTKTKPKKRSEASNRAYQRWYPEMSDALAMTIPEATRYIKLQYGLPILFANKYFGAVIHAGLADKGFFALSYEAQLSFMEKMPVTRLFDDGEHKLLRDQLQYFFGSLGVNLGYEK